MNDFHQRQRDIRRLVAKRACEQPLLPSGLWFHGDIRDNFYYASYLHAAATEGEALAMERSAAIELAASVLLRVLALQDRDPGSATYGHWPLNLGDEPSSASINRLPVELMGCLIVIFNQRYSDELSPELKSELEHSIDHMYRSRYYAEPLRSYHHHEAKHTAAALLFGTVRDDAELLQEGAARVRATLAQLETHGMTEYGILPWFWHWTQALSAAWELIHDDDIKADIDKLLQWLWRERADYYFRGAWAGPHSRSLPADAPADRCTAFDYVQFGDFPLPEDVLRPEYAGLLAYEIPESLRQSTLNRTYPCEIKRDYPASAQHPEQRRHSIVYMNEAFALGGMLERAVEFDNEQRRWDITFPIAGSAVNQAYFLLPASGGRDKLRHSGDAEDIVLERNCLMALYHPAADGHNDRSVAGVLPPGEWMTEGSAIYGQVGQALLAFYLMKPFKLTPREDGSEVEALEAGVNGVVVEAISLREAAAHGVSSLSEFAANRSKHAPVFGAEPLSASYVSLTGISLSLEHRHSADSLANRS